MTKIFLALILILAVPAFAFAQNLNSLAVLKYGGGGDWYANPTSVPNLIKFANANLGSKLDPEAKSVSVGSPDIFQYPFIHMTGHGNVYFTPSDVDNLRNYLIGGGFLHIDDNYGLDKSMRREMKKVFPELEFVELPSGHPIYNSVYKFPSGLPKIHEHDNKPAQGFGLIWEGRLVCFYSYESDLGDGWEDTSVHNDTDELHQKALQMGCNILYLAFSL